MSSAGRMAEAAVAAVGLALGLAACGVETATPTLSSPTPPVVTGGFALSSPAFAAGAAIPSQYTCRGANGSPPLAWTAPPAGTRSLALLVEDADAPGGTWVHWVLFNLPPTVRSLPPGLPGDAAGPAGGVQGQTSFGRPGYGGPCPPGGTHHYYFRLYALDAPLPLPTTAGRAQILAAAAGHILAQATLRGTFGN